MKMSKIKLIVTILVVVMVASLALNAYQWNTNVSLTKQNSNEAIASVLIHDAAAINAELQKLDTVLSDACQKLSTTGLTGAAADKVLSDLYAQNSGIVVNAATADKNGVIVAVQPSEYNNVIDQDISGQEQSVQMYKTMRPALSNLISLVEGYPGIVMVSPVFNTNGQFIGSLSVVFQPYQLMNPIVSASANGTYYTIYAVQSNGTLIYDANNANSGEQGKNIFTDEEYAGYTELQTFIHNVVDIQSGYGTYSFYDDLSPSRPLISKEGYWTTVGIYNTDWKLVVAQPLNQ